jgi:hypothetical protein
MRGGCRVVFARLRWLHVVPVATGPVICCCCCCRGLGEPWPPSLVLSSPRSWCRRCCRSLPLPSLSPRCRPVVVVSPVVPSKRPPAPAIPPASSGSQWRGRVLGRRFVGGFCRSSSAISTPNPPCEQSLAAVEVGAGVLVVWPPLLLSFASSSCLVVPRRPRSTHHPPHEQLLGGAGGGWCVVRSWAPSSSSSPVVPVPPTIHPTSSCSRGWRCVVRRPSSGGVVVVLCRSLGGTGACGVDSSRFGGAGVVVESWHPRSTLRAGARRRGGGCWVVCRGWGCAAAVPGVLGVLVLVGRVVDFMHPRSTLRAAARRRGAGTLSVPGASWWR